MLLSFFAEAQSVIPDQFLKSQSSLRTFSGTYSGLFFDQIPHPKGEVINEWYLNDHWNMSSILLKESEMVLENCLVKYNVKDETLEIKTSTDIKLLYVSKVKSVAWTDSVTNLKSYLISGQDFVENGAHLGGLLEVLADGKKPLLKRTTIYIKKPDYNVAMSVGSRDETVYQQKDLYVSTNNTLSKIKSKKDLLNSLQDQKELVESYIKDQQLNVKKEKDLIRALDFYNTQFKKGS